MLLRPTWFLLAAAGATLACVDPDPTAPSALVTPDAGTPLPVTLPIEVMPTTPEGLNNTGLAGPAAVVARTIHLDAAAPNDAALYLRGHGLARRDGYTGGAEASVRWDGGAWVDLDNAHVLPIGLDGVYGGIGGGFRTVRMLVPLALSCTGAACRAAGDHTLELRWNGTDGAGSGYRITELNLRTGAGAASAGTDLLPAFAVDDPDAWAAPRPAEIAAGEALWRRRDLLWSDSQPTRHRIVAACADCHAEDGRDLEYFAFSNASIIGRAVFHGLTRDQGEQIASYIRDHAAPRLGRPWNPPYQPGPGLDGNLAAGPDPDALAGWAAGAGVDAVQPETGALLPQLFPDGFADPQRMADNVRGIATTPLPARTTNLRQIPTAIQLPDWNAWLPEIHPLDLWGACAWDAGTGGFDAARTSTTALLGAPGGLDVRDVDHDGYLDALVALPSALRLWLVRGGSAGLGGAQTIYVAQPAISPSVGTSGDLDGDGDDDLIVGASALPGALWSLPSDGHGSFGPGAARATVGAPQALATGDWNGDGALDVVAAATAANLTAIHLGANGALGAAQPIAGGANPVDLAAADVTGDGLLDVVVVNASANQVRVLPGLGNGGFAAAITIGVGAGTSPQAVAVGDVDGDGQPELVVANAGAGGSLTLVRRTTTGFSVAAPSAIGGPAADVALSDVDDDHDLDVVIARRTANAIVVLHGDGHGAFTAPLVQPLAGPPGKLAVADVDRDGADDVVVTIAGAAPALVTLYGATCRIAGSTNPAQAYATLAAQLAALDRGDPVAVAALPYALGTLTETAQQFVGAECTWMNSAAAAGQACPDDGTNYRATRSPTLDAAVLRGTSMELAKRSLAQWIAVKYWEQLQANQLEGLGRQVFVTPPPIVQVDGEVLSWPMAAHQVVFPLAPHIMAADRNDFDPQLALNANHDVCATVACPATIVDAAQGPLKGDYDSTAWYHLQMILNAGARNRHPSVTTTSSVDPVDWPYALIHVDDLPRATLTATGSVCQVACPSPWEPVRYLATMMKAYQMRDNGKGAALTGWSMREVSPRLLVSNWRGRVDRVELLTELDHLDVAEPQLRAKVTEAFLIAFDDVTDGFEVVGYTWPRFQPDTDNDRETWWKLDLAETDLAAVTTPGPSDTWFPTGSLTHAHDLWLTVPLLRAITGVRAGYVDDLRAWAATEWPGPVGARNDWRR